MGALITFLKPEDSPDDYQGGFFVNESCHFESDGKRLYWKSLSNSMGTGNGTRIYIIAEGLQ